MEIFLGAVAIGAICSFLSYAIAKTPLSAVIGFLLGPIGVFDCVFLAQGTYSCSG